MYAIWVDFWKIEKKTLFFKNHADQGQERRDSLHTGLSRSHETFIARKLRIYPTRGFSSIHTLTAFGKLTTASIGLAISSSNTRRSERKSNAPQ